MSGAIYNILFTICKLLAQLKIARKFKYIYITDSVSLLKRIAVKNISLEKLVRFVD